MSEPELPTGKTTSDPAVGKRAPARRPAIRPAAVKTLCALFLLWSALRLISDLLWADPAWLAAVSLETSRWDVPGAFSHSFRWVIHLGALLPLLAAIGLWRYSRAAHKLAKLLSWYWLIFGGLRLLSEFPTHAVKITEMHGFLEEVPQHIRHLFIIPFVLLVLVQVIVLDRPKFRALFYPWERIAPPATDPPTRPSFI